MVYLFSSNVKMVYNFNHHIKNAKLLFETNYTQREQKKE